jgi:flagellar hook protein FlgE
MTVDGVPQYIELDFNGQPGTTSSANATNPSLGGTAGNGRDRIGLSSYLFDEKGILQLTYKNDDKLAGEQLALATFPSETELELIGNRLVAGSTTSGIQHGRAGEGAFGNISGGYLEMANVDLTQEFASMIIIQRGYQASSRVMTVSNEMIEQLYNSTRG